MLQIDGGILTGENKPEEERAEEDQNQHKKREEKKQQIIIDVLALPVKAAGFQATDKREMKMGRDLQTKKGYYQCSRQCTPWDSINFFLILSEI